jgi:hypothetical protein
MILQSAHLSVNRNRRIVTGNLAPRVGPHPSSEKSSKPFIMLNFFLRLADDHAPGRSSTTGRHLEERPGQPTLLRVVGFRSAADVDDPTAAARTRSRSSTRCVRTTTIPIEVHRFITRLHTADSPWPRRCSETRRSSPPTSSLMLQKRTPRGQDDLADLEQALH